ncbi:hypothetical protein BJ508DRAFT_73560 [Ascobolus immersus RN42]|uniref:Uncharacterized protein n=1 Tax=Ascobolus immersus RN42 TaxID=1160509 RepID=A0A3N4HHB7_ASCIM|nr:hypothetical protein BJ508DRAFT_73560 [Ascobolus immersus RN42]
MYRGQPLVCGKCEKTDPSLPEARIPFPSWDELHRHQQNLHWGSARVRVFDVEVQIDRSSMDMNRPDAPNHAPFYCPMGYCKFGHIDDRVLQKHIDEKHLTTDEQGKKTSSVYLSCADNNQMHDLGIPEKRFAVLLYRGGPVPLVEDEEPQSPPYNDADASSDDIPLSEDDEPARGKGRASKARASGKGQSRNPRTATPARVGATGASGPSTPVQQEPQTRGTKRSREDDEDPVLKDLRKTTREKVREIMSTLLEDLGYEYPGFDGIYGRRGSKKFKRNYEEDVSFEKEQLIASIKEAYSEARSAAKRIREMPNPAEGQRDRDAHKEDSVFSVVEDLRGITRTMILEQVTRAFEEEWDYEGTYVEKVKKSIAEVEEVHDMVKKALVRVGKK